ncbi:hypothetical protein JCM13369A_15090 [Mediterraneibacter glycyrrhizinilyticus JCM 13369]
MLGMRSDFRIVGEKIGGKIIPEHQKDRLEITGKLFTVPDIFIHDAALPGFISKDLVSDMIGDGSRENIHKFNAGMLMLRTRA